MNTDKWPTWAKAAITTIAFIPLAGLTFIGIVGFIKAHESSRASYEAKQKYYEEKNRYLEAKKSK